MLTKCQALCFKLSSYSMSTAILSEKHHRYPCFTGIQEDFEASRSRFSFQHHTLSGWNMNSDFFRNSHKPALLASYYVQWHWERNTRDKEWGGQHPCCRDTYNLSGGGIWKIHRPHNERQNVTAKDNTALTLKGQGTIMGD